MSKPNLELAKLKAVELISTGKSLDQANCTPELMSAVRELAEGIFGLKTQQQPESQDELTQGPRFVLRETERKNLSAEISSAKKYLARLIDERDGSTDAPELRVGGFGFKSWLPIYTVIIGAELRRHGEVDIFDLSRRVRDLHGALNGEKWNEACRKLLQFCEQS